MSNKRAQAISVANNYITLADGMIPGFKNILAKNVVLEWFGRKIIGERKVATFIISGKTKSFHMLHDITPISAFTTEKKQLNRSRESLDQNVKCETHTNYCSCEEVTRYSHEAEMSTNYKNEIDSDENNGSDTTFAHKNDCATFNMPKQITMMDNVCDDLNINTDVNVNIAANQNEISANAIAEMDDQSYDLNENDHYNLFKPEITSQAIVEKIQNINRIELKEEMAPTIRAITRERGQGDGPVIVEAGTTKYLEATGTIEFSQINMPEDSIFLYHWSKMWKTKNWKRKFKLKIAYSLLTDNESSKIVKKCKQENVCSVSHLNPSTAINRNTYNKQSKLPSLEEAIRVSNTLIPDKNYFGGYLKPLNFSEDREKFLKSFEAESQKEHNMQLCVHYVRNKLILDHPNKRPPLNIIYKIHTVIYTKIEQNESLEQEIVDAE